MYIYHFNFDKKTKHTTVALASAKYLVDSWPSTVDFEMVGESHKLN